MPTDKQKREWLKDIWIPFFSTIVALAGILSGIIIHILDSNKQIEFKKYEITLQTKHALYTSFMRDVADSFYATSKGKDRSELDQSLDRLEADYYGLEPFLEDNVRNAIWNDLQSFIQFCNNAPGNSGKTNSDYILYRNKFRDQLNSNLFGKYVLTLR